MANVTERKDVTRLVIVESPAKARKIASYLGDGYIVESSIGHIRDLPRSADEIPAAVKSQSWARLGVDTENDFQPLYVVPAEKKQHITKLKKLLKESDELFLATDEDREGEAIAWHLLDELKPKVPVKRMVFNEITKQAILDAVANPREIDLDLVDAQETRRILDRLYGYQVSPVLWKKVMTGLSAGRVQSVATRLVVDRERERMAFRSAAYWDLEAKFDAGADAEPRIFDAKLTSVSGQKVATGKDFDQQGLLSGKEVVHIDEQRAVQLAEGLRQSKFSVSSVGAKPYSRKPYEPFRTTTLQQESSRKLNFPPARTMRIAQRLYENGLITYMRTDSITLSQTAINAARAQVQELYGSVYLPDSPRVYASKVKNAQEAHEAIRPAGDRFLTPSESGLMGEELKVYELIWKRTLASQMKDAKGDTLSIRIAGTASDGTDVEFSASGRTITFEGFLKAYVESSDEPDKSQDDQQTRLPKLTQGQSLAVAELEPSGHETRPPARYTDASLIKELEERQIGRPSTYSSIIATILDRGYVYHKGSALVPAWLAFATTRLLEQHFSRLVDYTFTAQLEDVLDEVAGGKENRVAVLQNFWAGENEGNTGLKYLVENLGDIDARDLSTFPLGDGISLRVGRYGPYLEATLEEGDETPVRANVPEDMPPDELTLERAKELMAKPAGMEVDLGVDPETGLKIIGRIGRFGAYVTEVLPEDSPKDAKPKTASLFKSMDLNTLTHEDALKLLSLPRVLGTNAAGEEITVQNGRYGPYLKAGTDSRTLQSEDQIFAITLDEALAIYAQPKTYGRRAASAPLKELGIDPVSEKPIVAKEGRFGAYVTDGEYNATIPKDETIEDLTPSRAIELLAIRRAKGPAKKAGKKTAKKAAKKSTAKKSTAKKPAAKAAAKKSNS